MAGSLAMSPRRPVAVAMWWVERGLLVAGVVLFVFLVRRLGVGEVWSNLRLIGWGFLLVLAQEGVSYCLNTLGWRYAFPPPRPPIPFRSLVAARLGGEAINNLTPTATIGGEVVRARMLEGMCDPHTAWASVAVAKLSQTTAQMIFVFVGLIFLVRDVPLPEGFRRGLFIGLGAITTGLLLAIALQRRGMFGAAARLAARVGLHVPDSLHEQVARLDGEIARLYRAPWSFAASVAGFFGAWCMGAVEVYIIMTCLQLAPTWGLAFTVEVLSVAIDALFFFVPAKAGIQEGGKALIFRLLGFDPAKGLVLGIVRRLRELTWSSVGLIVLARRQARKRAARP
ncbi:MAG TPA: lysylphosphatidylglycerol synthase domain-containing protein [Candidatus Dormibacteraeota bacterium]|nr:lysylphosphatidylglycerol synthase domain-containing protein [Candidatus Dormibacteraeota bacterium]